MSTTTSTSTDKPSNEAGFGLNCVRVVIRPDAADCKDQLLFEVSCLMGNALAVFEAMGDAGDVPDAHFAGLYLLRQAHAAMNVLQGGAA
jgi:hypothetical protein